MRDRLDHNQGFLSGEAHQPGSQLPMLRGAWLPEATAYAANDNS
jgi:hypothetical protein